MPISRQEFEEGHIDLSFPISRILAESPESAFRPDELRARLAEREGRNASLEEVEEALEALVARGRVERKRLAGNDWYAIVVRRLGFVRE